MIIQRLNSIAEYKPPSLVVIFICIEQLEHNCILQFLMNLLISLIDLKEDAGPNILGTNNDIPEIQVEDSSNKF